MEFKFIDNNGVNDKNTRSLIRRHAARGQNLGRKITRPSRVKAFERRALVKPLIAAGSNNASAETSQGNYKEKCSSHRDIENVLSRIEPVIGDSVSVLSLPIEVAQEDRALMCEGWLARDHACKM
jgi:hypothetical protein